MTFRPRCTKTTLIFGGTAVWAIVLIGCVTANRTVVAPPRVADAKYVGSEACVQCHEDITKGFDSATHAGIMIKGENAKGLGCEACHGPGSKHVDSGGATGTIVNPRKSPETCFQCHLDTRGQFNLPHSHPVLAGHMSCVDCHDVHKGDAVRGEGATLESQNETCTRCHTAQKGPFVFEHEAMREGCTACHNPHGTVNAKMLLDRDANLCLRCHLAHPSVVGNGSIVPLTGDHSSPGDHATGRLEEGTCWSATCHEAPHGSNANDHLRY